MILKVFNNLKLKKKKLIQPVIKTYFYRLIAIGFGVITIKQIEAIRRSFVKNTNKSIKLDIKVKPNIPLFCKPLESRMGKGKGKFSLNIVNILPGQTVFIVNSFMKAKKFRDIAFKIFKKISIPLKVTL